jgi:hypothetical protein
MRLPYELFLSLLVVSSVFGQAENRIIPFPDWACDFEYDDVQGATPPDVHIELMDMAVAGRTVRLGEPFKADRDWLKKMILRVKNTGSKPVLVLGIGGGLLGGIDEKLPAGASYQYGINWTWGKATKPRRRRPKEPVVRPGEIVELSYAHVDPLTRKVLAGPGEGSFRRFKFMAPYVLYSDGTSVRDVRIKFPDRRCSD